ncbi:carbon starvation protein [Desulfotomaculum arcticum]|uniref:Carbon starvation protein n=1 Tax=Desulfotruncus arcticus DSM 17038 TaxID=1121424 RepID=A0A1I2U538_9FIRM|nr:carbon starvation protein A [Desulfotruncus arcticus]SFG72234.1 carbon starvation protein [Desulfotomaculum arcticum] [Desulfotruncus arcticus DSM 17038]
MSASILIIVSICAFFLAYLTYGAFLAKKLGLDPTKQTPAHSRRDGVDYIPARAPVLLGHHFASIAGAAPIIGPVTAAAFGWVPVALWIIFGGIFIGAVHDFTSLVASVRHGGRSIGEIINDNVGPTGKRLFGIFAWLTLVLIIAVFAIVIANTFVAVPAAASASTLFMIIAIIFGFTIYRGNASLAVSSIVGVALLIVAIWLGNMFPLALSFNIWVVVLFIYAFVASVTPVWILLQPRDYLNSFLLYGMIAGALVGLLISNPTIQLPAYTGFKTGLGYLFPVLFVTVACGAISGFHSLVASGTTAKQLDKETDARVIGYGGMLIECVLATIAIITAAVLLQDNYVEAMKSGGPVALFSAGVGGFLTKLGLSQQVGTSFAALVVSAFALTTLDTATRLARFIFQEFFTEVKQDSQDAVSSAKGGVLSNMFVGTGISVFLGALLALSGEWNKIWPIFGSANQLLAALALLAVSVWLARMGKDNSFTKYPMVFMFLVTLSALGITIMQTLNAGNYLLMIIAVLLFILAVVLAYLANVALKDAASGQNTIGA